MRYIKTKIMAALIIILVVGSLLSCTPSAPNAKTPSTKVGSISGSAAFEAIRQAADTYLSSGKALNTVWAEALYANLTDGKTANDPFIVSLRTPLLYRTGHICTAINIPIRALFMPTFIATLPTKDTPIVAYGATGNDDGQAVSLLNMLGYNVTHLQWGFTSWYKCPVTAPGLFRPAMGGGVGMNYPMSTQANVPSKTYDLPKVTVSGNTPEEVIIAAGNKYFLTEVPPPPDYIGTDAFYKDMFIEPRTAFNWLSSPATTPFILDIRQPEYYAKGHLEGAVNIPIREVAKIDNLKKLPPNQKILVVDNDGQAGGQVTSILNCLGYDAVELMWGMMGWTRDDNVVVHRFLEYEPGSDVKSHDIWDYPFCFVTDEGSYETSPNQ